MSISLDEYKQEIIICEITGSECIGRNCSDCDQTTEGIQYLREQHQKNLFEEYTKFHSSTLFGFNVQMNSSHTIAKITLNTLQELQKKGVVSTKIVPYHPESMKQYPLISKLRIYNSLPIPDTIWIQKDLPAALQYGDDVVYIIAPIHENRIE